MPKVMVGAAVTVDPDSFFCCARTHGLPGTISIDRTCVNFSCCQAASSYVYVTTQHVTVL